ncbi:MAG: aspartyl protease family protein [Gammaproteobacteria bacterium]
MPCLSRRFDISLGPIIDVIALGPGTVRNAGASGAQVSASAYPALIDTGATTTCISAGVASSLQLQPIGKRPMVSATHQTPVNAYLVDLLLPFGAAGHWIESIQVMEFVSGDSAIQMLLGRDIIGLGTLSISFDGHFTFCL